MSLGFLGKDRWEIQWFDGRTHIISIKSIMETDFNKPHQKVFISVLTGKSTIYRAGLWHEATVKIPTMTDSEWSEIKHLEESDQEFTFCPHIDNRAFSFPALLNITKIGYEKKDRSRAYVKIHIFSSNYGEVSCIQPF